MKNVDQGILGIMTSGVPKGCYRKKGSTYTKFDEEAVVARASSCLSRNGVTFQIMRSVFDPEIEE
jgi:hypothetical protein